MGLQEIRSSIRVLLVITVTVFPAVTLLAGQGLDRVLCTHTEPPRERVARVTAYLVLLVHTVTAQVWKTASHTEAYKTFALQGKVHMEALKLICASLCILYFKLFYKNDKRLASALHTSLFHLRAHTSSLSVCNKMGWLHCCSIPIKPLLYAILRSVFYANIFQTFKHYSSVFCLI